MENVSISFYHNSKGKYNAIYMCVTCPQSPRLQIRFPHFTCEKKDWSNGRFIIGRGNSTNRQKQQRLDNLKADTHKFIGDFLKKHNCYPTKADLDFFVQKGEPSKKPISVERAQRTKGGRKITDEIDLLIKDLKEGNMLTKGKRIGKSTIDGYGQILKLLREFEISQGKPLTAKNLLEEKTIRAIELYLTNDKQFKLNSVGKGLKNLKAIVGILQKRGTIEYNSFLKYGIRIPKEEASNIALSEEELMDLLRVDVSDNKTFEVVRDHFICMCYTGLRVSDYREFIRMDLSSDVVEMISKKTGVKCAIPILPPVRQIIEKYDGQLPPMISDQKMGKYIKVIAQRVSSLHQLVSKVATIGGRSVTQTLPKYQMITNHTARRTMVTLFSKWGVAEHDIMAITGHRDHRTLRSYDKMLKSEKVLTVLKQIQHRFN